MSYKAISQYFNELIMESGSEKLQKLWIEKQEDFKKRFKKKLDRKDNPRKKKSPNAPKGPKNAYIFYSNELREEVKNELQKDDPKVKSKEVLSELGKRWKELNEKRKIKYEKMAKADKERYVDEMKNYIPDPNEEIIIKGGRKKKDPNSPKGARNAYIFFSGELRKKIKKDHPELDGKEVSSKLGHMWKELSEKKKKKYEEMAEEDKKRYKKEYEKYKRMNDISDSDSEVSDIKKYKARRHESSK